MAEQNVSDWKCKNGHVMGVVQRMGDKSSRLLLYRNALDMGQVSPRQVDVIAVVDAAADIRCDVCGYMRTWSPSQEAFEKLMGHYAKRRESVQEVV